MFVYKKVRAALFFCVSLFGVLNTASSQSIKTAGDFFKEVSDQYAALTTYEAQMEILTDKTEMRGRVSFKKPDLLRIDFSNPQEQVIVFNGELLTIYIPGSDAILQQSVQNSPGSAGTALATPQGLSLMTRYYTIAYESGQDPAPLESDSTENVVKLLLTRRNSSESFRTIKLAISPETKLIRRVEAVTTRGETITFNFSDYVLNRAIPDQRFIYDPPSSANNYNNFLFSE
ncbi:outer membrane lipoprotein carrier protein LolA [Treponema parvum]|uniref:Outer membrane lipoprotein carrier protein LolA n=1 Tax=Treponema parvum TaxID=138851 RepID=A0A975F594_9SPIR|nr:outer membrane lipoprotein carrier protein LolA [Treponema parvum]QTQ14722.1 outer membrane lipoprotein carrier protein LolA [Treponema parvum]